MKFIKQLIEATTAGETGKEFTILKCVRFFKNMRESYILVKIKKIINIENTTCLLLGAGTSIAQYYAIGLRQSMGILSLE